MWGCHYHSHFINFIHKFELKIRHWDSSPSNGHEYRTVPVTHYGWMVSVLHGQGCALACAAFGADDAQWQLLLGHSREPKITPGLCTKKTEIKELVLISLSQFIFIHLIHFNMHIMSFNCEIISSICSDEYQKLMTTRVDLNYIGRLGVEKW